MGLPKSGTLDVDNVTTKRFSDDILKIELTGPEQSHLSVVDVPGLFHSECDTFCKKKSTTNTSRSY